MNGAGFQPQAGAELSARELGSPGAPQAAMMPPQQGQSQYQNAYQNPNQLVQVVYQGNYQGGGSGSAQNGALGGRGLPGVDPGYFFIPQAAGHPATPNHVSIGYQPVVQEQVSMYSNWGATRASSAAGPAPDAFNSWANVGSNSYHGSGYPIQQNTFPTNHAAAVVPAPAPTPAEETGELPVIKEETTEDVDMADGGS